jgi:hypothetical protein
LPVTDPDLANLAVARSVHDAGRMRLLIVVLALAACSETRQIHRWPQHRRDKDEQIELLLRRTDALEQRVKLLEQRAPNAREVPQPAPSALPSPGT